MGQQFASSGRLKLTVKFSELPCLRPVQGGLKIGFQTAMYLVTANPPPKIRGNGRPDITPLESGRARVAGAVGGREIALKQPAVQGFETQRVRPAFSAGRGDRAASSRASHPRAGDGRRVTQQLA